MSDAIIKTPKSGGIEYYGGDYHYDEEYYHGDEEYYHGEEQYYYKNDTNVITSEKGKNFNTEDAFLEENHNEAVTIPVDKQKVVPLYDNISMFQENDELKLKLQSLEEKIEHYKSLEIDVSRLKDEVQDWKVRLLLFIMLFFLSHKK